MHIKRDLFLRVDELSISIVAYRPDVEQLAQTLTSLRQAARRLLAVRPQLQVTLFLVDNGGMDVPLPILNSFSSCGIVWKVIAGHGNVGYGAGHNLAIEHARSGLHLVLNPDIDVASDALVMALTVFEADPELGLLSPWIGDDVGNQQYLCRRFPSVFDLFVRGFLPARTQRLFARRLARYEMRDVINDCDVVQDPPIVSGCFMLFRTDVLKKLNGFDPRYFLYFEDYDLSLRTHEVARVAYVPPVRVIHHGGGASRKGLAHIRMFAASAFKFYNRFGWRLW
ncbi:glycosyltransferase [Burkholderia multivorans]|uniref:glycosyltransferase n=1 Tax=Burkholderia multivorans TaxID=87883 RepID=UPI0019D6C47A|nr:glycosyltransferase [Burkholderia multivorans]MBN8169620.1 glycosyltransferase [Burkholderia multivorans]